MLTSIDLFLCAIGREVTLKKETTPVYTDLYHELDEENTTYTETTIRVVLDPGDHDWLKRMNTGLVTEPGQLTCFFRHDANVAIGDLIVDGSLTYRVHSLKQTTYRGLTSWVGVLEREP